MECAQGDAIPYGLCVINTWCIGGRESAADWWRVVISATLALNKKTEAEFDADVAKCDENGGGA